MTMEQLFLHGWQCWCNILRNYCLHPSISWEVVCIFGCIFSIDGSAQFDIVLALCIIVYLVLYSHQLFCTQTAKHTSGTMWMAQQNVDECLAEFHGAQAWTQIAFHCSGCFSSTLSSLEVTLLGLFLLYYHLHSSSLGQQPYCTFWSG